MCFVITTSPLGVGGKTPGVREERGGGLFPATLPSPESSKTRVSLAFGAGRRRHGGGMRTCARWRRRDGLPLRPLVLLVPPVLLTLQLLVVGLRLPQGSGRGLEGQEGSVAFSVISIEPERSARRREPPSRRPAAGAVGEEEEEEEALARAYEDENEMLSRKVNRNKLQQVTLHILPISVYLDRDFTCKIGTVLFFPWEEFCTIVKVKSELNKFNGWKDLNLCSLYAVLCMHAD